MSLSAIPYTEDDSLLRIDKVSKSFADQTILREVSAEIKDIHRQGCVTGQVVGFLGPSGSGKTTLLRIIAGLLAPDSGAVTLDGGRAVAEGDVGVVAQSYPLFAHRTVWGNLLLATQSAAKIADYLISMSLEDCREKYPAQLSGGQRQRVAIGQQVLRERGHFLLMDEPFSGLDPIAKRKTENVIQKVANLDEKATVIIVSHDVRAVAAICDHVWLLGRDRTAEGGLAGTGSTIKRTYNLIERGLCYQPEIRSLPEFMETVVEIEQEFATL